MIRRVDTGPAGNVSRARRVDRVATGGPSQTALFVWLDASETSTITSDGSSRVSAWRSKVGTTTFAQGTPANQPLVSNGGFSGRQSIYFDGATTAKTLDATLAFAGVTGVTIYLVSQGVTYPASTAVVIGSAAGPTVFKLVAATGSAEGQYSSGSFTIARDTSVPVGTGPHVHAASYNLIGPNAAISLFREGAKLPTNYTFGPDVVGTIGNAGMRLGADGGNGFRIDGYIGEILIYLATHSDAEVLTVSNYLKGKWGIGGFDPVTDPVLSPGLILDICPDYAGTVTSAAGRVSAIADRSAQANNFQQLTGANQPFLNATDANYGGRASISGTGTHWLTSVAGLTGIGATCTIAVVERLTSFAASAGLASIGAWAGGTNQNPGAAINSFTDSNIYGRVATTIATQSAVAGAVNTVQRIVATYNISASPILGSIRSNNGTPTTSSTAAATNTYLSAPMYIGSLAGAFGITGSLARVLVWNRVLNASEMQTLDDGLKSFFSL